MTVLGPALVLMATLSRYAMVQMACFSPYPRPSGGLGEPFVRGIRSEHHLVVVGLALGCVLLFGGLRGLCIGVLVGLWYSRAASVLPPNALGGITGDVLGTTNELKKWSPGAPPRHHGVLMPATVAVVYTARRGYLMR